MFEEQIKPRLYMNREQSPRQAQSPASLSDQDVPGLELIHKGGRHAVLSSDKFKSASLFSSSLRSTHDRGWLEVS